MSFIRSIQRELEERLIRPSGSGSGPARTPTEQWERIRNKQVVRDKTFEVPRHRAPGTVRFVCISDTHSKKIDPEKIPYGDVLLHAGDFTNVGKPAEVEAFNRWLGELPHPTKVVIAGNHDLSLDTEGYPELGPAFGHRDLPERPEDVKALSRAIKAKLTNCIYLEDSETTVHGVRVYGSPWQPEFHGWAFNLRRGEECAAAWARIPPGVDVLMTHGPPMGHGDRCFGGHVAGCYDLLRAVEGRVRPRFHVFGHIHEGYGVTTNGTTDFINASTCNLRYRPSNPAIVFDVEVGVEVDGDGDAVPRGPLQAPTTPADADADSDDWEEPDLHDYYPGADADSDDCEEPELDDYYPDAKPPWNNSPWASLGLSGPPWDDSPFDAKPTADGAATAASGPSSSGRSTSSTAAAVDADTDANITEDANAPFDANPTPAAAAAADTATHTGADAASDAEAASDVGAGAGSTSGEAGIEAGDGPAGRLQEEEGRDPSDGVREGARETGRSGTETTGRRASS